MVNKFKHRQEILYRTKNSEWTYGIVSHIKNETCVVLVGGIEVHTNIDTHQIIPYENNVHLVGTNQDIYNPIFLNTNEYIIVNNDLELLKNGIGYISTFLEADNDDICTGKNTWTCERWNYAIRLKDYNFNNPKNNYNNIIFSKNSILSKINQYE